MSIEPKMPSACASRDLVLEAVAGERARGCASMLTLISFSSPCVLQEAVHGGDVEVVLVLGRLARLGLDQDRALEADLVLVLDDHAA